MVPFQTKKIPIWVILEGPRLANVDILYGHLEYFTNIWDTLWPLGTFCVHLVIFFRFGYHVPRKKSGNPGLEPKYWIRRTWVFDTRRHLNDCPKQNGLLSQWPISLDNVLWMGGLQSCRPFSSSLFGFWGGKKSYKSWFITSIASYPMLLERYVG
jgi:hypothetical protein